MRRVSADRAATPPEDAPRPIRVLVVEDSHLIAWLLRRWIEEEPGLELAGAAKNGEEAPALAAKTRPDVVLLDIEMPVMDGLQALPLILDACPSARVLMVSALTQRNAQMTFEALSRGAADYLAKPEPANGGSSSPRFRDELVAKIKAVAQSTVRSSQRFGDASRLGPDGSIAQLRPFSMVVPRLVTIGSSTGGPNALTNLLTPLRNALHRVPVLITQHMPSVFTAALAERIQEVTGLPAKEGEDGEALRPGHIYLAPGERHMVLAPGDKPTISINDAPPLNFHRPSVDLLFESAAGVYGAGVLAVVLTGMGSDGTSGAKAIVEKGGNVLVQDKCSSVVWGMPAAVLEAGLASAEGPPLRLAETMRMLLQGERL
ncbi:chemotaxis response regulator protein-glutamate methylesterase [Methyloligella sp. 2.7D]|uniref:protein-glutamate methylesterase/protein-glutamine glutaminase n=1 Tax=unclassified Methyloligella TaxID=2625955 RepID=UPI00157DE532|nr:chemotaxis response regulator protein-glutamate methylesterase [Methyloligella sp. GL2]QKP76923.1 chemotaxis response regulator protein-glutamate methylesterase [Methyloligella sp. GL2]